MCVVEHVLQLMIVNAGSLQFIFCLGKAEIACIHLDPAIFVESKSMLIHAYYLHSTVSPQIVSVEKPLKRADIRQVSAETSSNEILSGGLAVSQGEVTHECQWQRKLLYKYI